MILSCKTAGHLSRLSSIHCRGPPWLPSFRCIPVPRPPANASILLFWGLDGHVLCAIIKSNHVTCVLNKLILQIAFYRAFPLFLNQSRKCGFRGSLDGTRRLPQPRSVDRAARLASQRRKACLMSAVNAKLGTRQLRLPREVSLVRVPQKCYNKPFLHQWLWIKNL